MLVYINLVDGSLFSVLTEIMSEKEKETQHVCQRSHEHFSFDRPNTSHVEVQEKAVEH